MGENENGRIERARERKQTFFRSDEQERRHYHILLPDDISRVRAKRERGSFLHAHNRLSSKNASKELENEDYPVRAHDWATTGSSSGAFL